MGDIGAGAAAGTGSQEISFEPIRVVRAAELSSATAQTPGMLRLEAVSGRTVGSRQLWMGRATAAPGVVSAAHHHGASETSFTVTRGRAVFLCGPELRTRVEVNPGDFVYVPPFAVHVEATLGDEEVEFIVARSTQAAIVVNLPDLTVPPEAVRG